MKSCTSALPILPTRNGTLEFFGLCSLGPRGEAELRRRLDLETKFGFLSGDGSNGIVQLHGVARLDKRLFPPEPLGNRRERIVGDLRVGLLSSGFLSLCSKEVGCNKAASRAFLSPRLFPPA